MSHRFSGNATPKIEEPIRIFVTEIRKTMFRTDKNELNPFTVYINPEIIMVSHETESGWEECGSVENAGKFGEVKLFQAHNAIH